MQKRIILSMLVLAAASGHAANFSTLKNLSQSEFESLAHDLGSLWSYKALNPGDPLGIIGFDVGAEATVTHIDDMAVMKKAADWSSSVVTVGKLHAHKGLPFNVDVGAFMGNTVGFDARLVGAELRWAVLPGNVLLPALAVRGTYTKLGGIKELNFNSTGLEATVSKGFLMFKPWLGLGYVRSNSSANVGNLKSEHIGQHKVFGGVNVNLGLVNYAFEIDQTGKAKTYGAKIGLRF